MPKIAIIPGYAGGLYAEILKSDQKYYKFKVFQEEIESGQAKILKWHKLNLEVKLKHIFNFKLITKSYLFESTFIKTKSALDEMESFFNVVKPEIILAHSLGSSYILNYLNDDRNISNIKEIHLIHGAFPVNFKFENQDIIQKIINKELKIINHFCFLDFILLVYIVLQKKFPSGLYGTSNPYILNKISLYPKLINPHFWALESLKFKQKILKLK